MDNVNGSESGLAGIGVGPGSWFSGNRAGLTVGTVVIGVLRVGIQSALSRILPVGTAPGRPGAAWAAGPPRLGLQADDVGHGEVAADLGAEPSAGGHRKG